MKYWLSVNKMVLQYFSAGIQANFFKSGPINVKIDQIGQELYCADVWF